MRKHILAVALVVAGAAAAVADDQPERPEKAPARFRRFLDPAVKDGVITRWQADRLESAWSSVRIGDLPPDASIEEGLARVGSGILSKGEADSLVARASSASPVEQGEAVSWLSRVASALPWVGGIALAIGAFALLVKWLADAPAGLQTVAAGLATAALLWGASRLGAAHWGKASEVLSVAGAVGILGTAALLAAALEWNPGLPTASFILAVAWGIAACALGSSLVAFMSAVAVAVLVGDEAGLVLVWQEEKGPGGPTLAFVGSALVGVGYGALFARSHVLSQLETLVRPFWLGGVLSLLASAGISWDWKEWLSPSRIWAFLLGIILVSLGDLAHEGLYVGAGGLALIAWSYVTLWDVFGKALPVEWTILLTGLLTLGLAFGLDHWWAGIISLLTATSF